MKISKFVLSLAMFATTVPFGFAAPSCTPGGVNGTYGIVINAVSNDGTRGTGIGLITFDGASTNQGANLFTSLGPSGYRQQNSPFTGTYTVSPDCTGTVTTFDIGGGGASNFNFAVNNSENGSQFIRTNGDYLQYGSLVAQGDISAWAGRKHTYAANLTGRIAGIGPIAYVGQIIMKADGTVGGTMTVSSNTAVYSGAITGSYVQNQAPYGTGRATITLPGLGDTHFSFIIVDSGKQILMLQTDDNTVVSGPMLHLGAVS